jgi:glycolate oxidase iron-sulfur subunit
VSDGQAGAARGHAARPRHSAILRRVTDATARTRPTHPDTWFDANDAPPRIDLDACIHCGLCLTACPTYRTLKVEPDSPRGRLYLMRGLAEGRIGISDPMLHHLDQCLDCRACETVCPAGVPYSRLLESTRGQLERRARPFSAARALGGWALRTLFPERARMHAVADLLRLTQSGPLAALTRFADARGLLPGFAKRGIAITPPIAPRAERALERVARALPPGARMDERVDALVFHPAGRAKARIAFFSTCVMDVMFADTNRAAVRLLVLAGAEVVWPRDQSCCGALHAHAGLRDEAKALARRNVRALAPGGYDLVVTHAAGCGAALREMDHLLRDEGIAEDASAVASRVRDVSEALVTLGLPEAWRPLSSAHDPARPLRVGYHDPCHLAHAQGVRAAPRTLLRAVPGLELVDLPNADWCCGSAGVYNLTHPAMAEEQLRLKLDSVERVSPEVVVASNPGCLLHMKRGAEERGSRVRMEHLVDVLARAYPVA